MERLLNNAILHQPPVGTALPCSCPQAGEQTRLLTPALQPHHAAAAPRNLYGPRWARAHTLELQPHQQAQSLRAGSRSAAAVHEAVQDHVEVDGLAAVHELGHHRAHLVPREAHVGHVVDDLRAAF